MKVIFLDIDGVLNSSRTVAAFGRFPYDLAPGLPYFDLVALGMVRRLCDETGARVVISSTWRIGRNVTDFVPLQLPVVGLTPIKRASRGHEIAAWLSDQCPGSVEAYVILDDDSDMLPGQVPYFVHTSIEDGLLYSHYEQALRILTGAS